MTNTGKATTMNTRVLNQQMDGMPRPPDLKGDYARNALE